MTGEQHHKHVGVFALTICLVLLATGLWMLLFRPLTIDDAFITFRFSHNANQGHGLVWNVGESPVEGMTSFLWTVILIPFASDKHSLYLWAKVLGALAGLGAAYVILESVKLAFGGRCIQWGALFLVVCPLLAFHSLNGLETGLVLLLTSAMLFSSIKILSRPNGSISGSLRWAVVLGLLWLAGGMTRPELVLYGLLMSLFVFLRLESGRRRARLSAALFLSFVLPGSIYFVSRWQYFGFPFPLPFYAKHSEALISPHGTGYVALSFLGVLGGLGALGFLSYFIRGCSEHLRGIIGISLWPALIVCLCYAFFDPLMGFVYRFTTPFIGPLIVAASGSVCTVRSGTSVGRIRLLTSSLVVLATAQLLSGAIPAYHWAHINSEATRDCHQRVGETLALVSEDGSLIAVADVGGPAFFSGWKSHETLGLVTPEASMDGLSTGQLIESFKPDVLIISSYRKDKGVPDYARGYRLAKAVPWLVFSDEGPKSYQCVLARTDYPRFDELRTRLRDVGSREFPLPWYFRAYIWLKKSFRQ